MSKKRSVATIEKDNARRRVWYKTHKQEAKTYHAQWLLEHPDYDRVQKKKLRDKYRDACYGLLGDKCANPNCRWLNEDGTLGCKDRRLFHLDHIEGGGRKERKQLHNNDRTLCRKILKAKGKGYRILCAACNWLHLRHEVI